MAKKKKNSKKARIQQKSQRQQQSAETLIEQAEKVLSTGKAREAVELAKIAAKKVDAPAATQILLFRAYIAREQQLLKKGMRVEADAVNRLAMACIAGAGRLDEANLVLFAASAPAEKAFEAYADYLLDHLPSLPIERQLVNRLLQTEKWDLLERLNPDVPIRKDASSVPAAVLQMNAARWRAALEHLRDIPRSSPFAPLRLLCRAMAAFYAGDDKDCVRALSMIDEDFLLYPMTSSLQNYLSAGTGSHEQADYSDEALHVLFEGPIDAEKAMHQLILDIKRKNIQNAIRRIDRLSREIYPEDPQACKSTILEITSNMVDWGKCEMQDFIIMINTILDEDAAKSLVMRMDMFGPGPLYSAADYIAHMPRLFSDPHHRKTAKSLVLLEALKKSREKETLNYELSYPPVDMSAFYRPPETPWHLLGIDRQGINRTDTPHPYLAMAKEGIASDPDNREWYEQIANMPRNSRVNQKIVEEAFLKMAERFPEDPFPFIELAGLYADKKAHRKAENAIEKAARLAPYDNRVIDQKAVLLLTSVQINIDRDKHHLARADLEKAAALESRPAAPFVAEKAILLDLAEAPADAGDVIANALCHRDPFERLYLKVLLMMDIAPVQQVLEKFSDGPRIMAVIQSQINTDFTALSDNLRSGQVMQLLSPIPRNFAPVMPRTQSKTLKDIFSEDQTAAVLRKVDDSDIIFACDQLIPTGRHAVIVDELLARLNMQGFERSPVMNFYQLILNDLSGVTTDSASILKLINASSPETVQQLREASKRLAPHASGYQLKKALLYFNFRMINPESWMFDTDGDNEFYDPYDDYYNNDFDDDFHDDAASYTSPALDSILNGDTADMSNNQLVEGLEQLVDYLYCRGLPTEKLRMTKQIVLEFFPHINSMDELLPNVPKKVFKRLSREARILFFE